MARALVIGSGPGGSIAAMTLAQRGWDVTIFEKGPNYFDDLTSQRPRTVFSNDELKHDRHFSRQDPTAEPRVYRTSAGDSDPQVGTVQSLPQTVGGGTAHWDAKTPRFWDIDFQKLTLLGPQPGADVIDWPFTYEELAPLYEEVEALIGVAGDVSALPAEPTLAHAPRSGEFPMAGGPPQYSSTVVARGATSLGLHPFLVPMAINSVPYDGRPACVNLWILCRLRLSDHGADRRSRPPAARTTRGCGAAHGVQRGQGDNQWIQGHRGELGGCLGKYPH